jgi:enoyl-[acyl-carrier protein] reductase I
MPLLSGKKILVTGLLSNRSIAYGIAKAAHREGAELAFTYQNERFKDRVADLAAEFGSKLAVPCDVANDAEIDSLFQGLKSGWGRLDGLVHAIAFAPRESIAGDFLDGSTREAFRIAHDVSSYSFAALAGARCRCSAMRPRDPDLSRRGAGRANYTPWASRDLEAAVRYLAASPGRAASASTASGGADHTSPRRIGGFGKILKFVSSTRRWRNVTTGTGNAAAFLLSDLAAAVTGEILVDAGFSHVMAGSLPTSSPDSAD